MRQNQKVLKKGDYYELLIQQEAVSKQQKAVKKQQFPSALSIPATDQIVTNIPNHSQARSNYFFVRHKHDISRSGLQQLQDELRTMLQEQQDVNIQQQIEALVKQIQLQKEDKTVPLNQLACTKRKEQQNSLKRLELKEIQLLMKLDFGNLQQKLQRMEQLNYPQITQMENLFQVMLGERAIKQNTTNANTINAATTMLMNLDQKTKQDIETLYTHFNSLSCLNNLSNLIEDLHSNDGKAIQMNQWVQKAEQIAQLNQDFSIELEADAIIIEQLRVNFDQNMKTIKAIIQTYKQRK